MKTDNNNIIFRASWMTTLKRWDGDLVKEFVSALDDFYNNREVEIKSDRVQDLWEQALPLLEADRTKYESRSKKASENGRKGGAPKGNQNAVKQPNSTENNQKQAKQAIEKEIEIEIDNVITSEEVITNRVDLGGYGNFLKKFPPAKQRDIQEGKLIWDSFQQEEKAEVIRHVSSYIKKMIADGQEQYIKNSFAYLESELWLDMKPRSFVAKPIDRGMRNMTFINFYSKLKSISEDEATAFLYRTSTDKEFSQALKLYQAEKDKLFQIKN